MAAPSNQQTGGGGVMDVPMLNLAMLPRLKVPQGCRDVQFTGSSDKSTETTIEGNGVETLTGYRNSKEESGKHGDLSARILMAHEVRQQMNGPSEGKGFSPRRHVLPNTFTALTIASPKKSLEATPSPDGGRTPRVCRMKPSMHSPLRMVGKASPCSVRIQSSARLEGSTITHINFNIPDNDHMGQRRREEMIKKEHQQQEEAEGRLAKTAAADQTAHEQHPGVGRGGQKGSGMAAHVARMMDREGSNNHFRELSFGNLLDREAVTDVHNQGGGNNASPKPIGLFPSPARKHSPVQNRNMSSSSSRPENIPNGSKAQSISQRHHQIDFASQELKSPRKRSRKSSAPMRSTADAY